MKLWILSDLHMESRVIFDPPRSGFDVLIAAGDIAETLETSIAMVAALAGGKSAVFVAGNHEWSGDPRSIYEKLVVAHCAATSAGVHFLESDSVEIGGVRFAGATLWTPDDVRHLPSAKMLMTSCAGVIVSHFEPAPALFYRALSSGGLWIYGHHHGHEVRHVGSRTLIRNALGYGEEEVNSGVPDFIYDLETGRAAK